VLTDRFQQRLRRSNRTLGIGYAAFERFFPGAVNAALIERNQRLGNQVIRRLRATGRGLASAVDGVAGNTFAGSYAIAISLQDGIELGDYRLLLGVFAPDRMDDVFEKRKQLCLRTSQEP